MFVTVNDDADDDDESDDEPLAKKVKSAPSVGYSLVPWHFECSILIIKLQDEELADTIEQLLEDADLEEVTMNKLCQQVYFVYI